MSDDKKSEDSPVEWFAQQKAALAEQMRREVAREARAVIEHEQAVAINKSTIENNTPESMREWNRHQVAVAAMQGMLADPDVRGTADEIAAAAYDFAEAMMVEREKRRAEGR
jgi:hypothetical protein